MVGGYIAGLGGHRGRRPELRAGLHLHHRAAAARRGRGPRQRAAPQDEPGRARAAPGARRAAEAPAPRGPAAGHADDEPHRAGADRGRGPVQGGVGRAARAATGSTSSRSTTRPCPAERSGSASPRARSTTTRRWTAWSPRSGTSGSASRSRARSDAGPSGPRPDGLRRFRGARGAERIRRRLLLGPAQHTIDSGDGRRPVLQRPRDHRGLRARLLRGPRGRRGGRRDPRVGGPPAPRPRRRLQRGPPRARVGPARRRGRRDRLGAGRHRARAPAGQPGDPRLRFEVADLADPDLGAAGHVRSRDRPRRRLQLRPAGRARAGLPRDPIGARAGR